MSKFKTELEDVIIIRGTGEVKVRKAEEIKDFTDLEPEAQDESR